MKSRNIKSLLGLELSERRLTVVDLRRANGSRVAVRGTSKIPLTLDPLTAAPELAAREIAEALRLAGIRPGRCIVCLPLKWLLMHPVEVPAIDEADVADFLNLEAEHAFPFAPEDLSIATSRFADPGSSQRVLLTAMPNGQVAAVERVLRLAGLRPLSMTVSAAALTPPGGGPVEGAIAWTDSGAQLVVTLGGGIVALRALGEAPEAADRDRVPDMETLVRECRISLGRLPAGAREGLRRVRIFGPADTRAELVGALEPELDAMGLGLESAGVDAAAEIVATPDAWRPAGLTLATSRWLKTGQSALEFLPPRVGPLRQFARRLMAGGLIWKLAAVAGCLALIAALGFGWQSWRLHRLENRWASIQSEVDLLKARQQKIRQFRPWFEDRVEALEIAKTVTEAFPERGDVWTRSLEIQNQSEVICTGFATSNDEYLKMFNALRATDGVQNLQIKQMRGDRPVQFSLSFDWTGGPGNGR
jgi:hypothetical protein